MLVNASSRSIEKLVVGVRIQDDLVAGRNIDDTLSTIQIRIECSVR